MPNSTRHGFTLIEVMAVVALIGLLASATAWSLADSAQRAQQTDVIDRLIHADESARAAARRLGPRSLHIDLDRQQVWVQGPADKAGRPTSSHKIGIPTGFRIDQARWIDQDRINTRENRRAVTAAVGEIQIPISSEGFSRTYALRLVGPKPVVDEQHNTNERTRHHTWLLFSGLTGRVTSDLDENELEAIYATLASTRPNAD